ncbi:MAG: HDOD domain-containing protein [Azoarcus sp.]|nr:HDOD domain-containing protein [Azoarcus sp.]
MLTKLFHRLLHRPPSPVKKVSSGDSIPASTEALDRQAPLRQEQTPEVSGNDGLGATILCREAILDRQQKIAGYQFMLQETVHAHIRSQSRRIFHLYAEVLIRQLARANIGPLLGHRIALVEIPDSFLDSPQLTQLPPDNTLFILRPIEDANAPSEETLRERVRDLRTRGYRVGIPYPLENPVYQNLLPDIDLVSLQGDSFGVGQGIALARNFLKTKPHAALLARDLPGMEDFDFCFKIGVTLFQGAFITSREQWPERNLGPDFSRLSMLLNKLREDADTREIVALFKQDAAITLRLLRYINSAANGLREHVASIEQAIALLGRAPLRRWLALLLCSSNRDQPRAAAVLETALIRARTMELISASRTVAERETIFLTGLLSLIDVILQQPLEHALETLAIDTEIREALLNEQGPYAPALTLARACESRNTGRIVAAAAACGVDPEQASIWYMDALAWTLTLQQENSN